MHLTFLYLFGWSVFVGALDKDESYHTLKVFPDKDKSDHTLEELPNPPTEVKSTKCTDGAFCLKYSNADFQQFASDFAKEVAKQKSSEQFMYVLTYADHINYGVYYGLLKEYRCSVETGPINIVQEQLTENQELHHTNYFHNDQSEPLAYTLQMPFIFNVQSTNVKKNWLTWYPPWEACANNIHVIKEWKIDDTICLLGPLQSNIIKTSGFSLLPNETAELKWYVKTYTRLTAWEMDVRFRGDIRINTRDARNNAQWHRYSFGLMAGDNSLFRRDGYDLLYTVSGVLISTYASDDVLLESKFYQDTNGSRNEYPDGTVKITPLATVMRQLVP